MFLWAGAISSGCSNLWGLSQLLNFFVLPETLAVSRLSPGNDIPNWAVQSDFFCVTRTPQELSIVCAESLLPPDAPAERGWIALKLAGPLPFTLTGVLASFIQPLAKAEIGIFAISTFDTDYVLIKRENLDAAIAALAGAGHEKFESQG